MDEIWTRIDTELKRRRKDWQWLYTTLGYDRQRVNNWSRRGVPAKEYAAIAEALETTIDWVTRGDPPTTSDGESVMFLRSTKEPSPPVYDFESKCYNLKPCPSYPMGTVGS